MFNSIRQKNASTLDISSLIAGRNDLLIIEDFIAEEALNPLQKEIKELQKDTPSEYKLEMSDGTFFPLPYSTIRSDQESQHNRRIDYFKSANFFKDYLESKSPSLKLLQERIETTFGLRNLKIGNDSDMLKIATRLLYQSKNGIDIHCENAFLNQLEDNFKQEMYAKIDLENALSFFVVIEAAETGGELVLYNHVWQDVQIEINKSSYFERHDEEGSIFTNRGFNKPQKQKISLKAGDAIVFRAAQIWHAIAPIEDETNRLTLGCFIAKSSDGRLYYWA